jgi:hypothetical protein
MGHASAPAWWPHSHSMLVGPHTRRSTGGSELDVRLLTYLPPVNEADSTSRTEGTGATPSGSKSETWIDGKSPSTHDLLYCFLSMGNGLLLRCTM